MDRQPDRDVVTDEWVGARIRELREAAGMSQADLATGMVSRGHPWHQSTVYRIEHGLQPLNARELPDLAAILGIRAARLLESDDAGLADFAEERRVMEQSLRQQIAAEVGAVITGRPGEAA